ncbi:hypothetical protein [Parachitinimonas caeni]|uniref:Uncharacterized protein n=1 Tax=Parachitinimonas caeni TaxID=3031301 RepID=A0ABT7DV68_9NEIS|nr:hypothetical protein [Parachitinimonas caeni]MDK2123965.1 hypothetical protein [Parachitinimonas caeni]
MKRLWQICAALALCMPLGSSYAAYTVKVTMSMPKGTTGEKPAANFPTNTKIIPCDGPGFDAISFSVTYDASNANKTVDRDLFIFLHTPDGSGIPRFLVAKKQNLGSNFIFLPREDVKSLQPKGDYFIPRTENLTGGGPVTTVLMDTVSVQAASSGIWQLIAIVGDGNSPKFSFDNPSTWDAWDVATVMLRKPWVGFSTQTCQ